MDSVDRFGLGAIACIILFFIVCIICATIESVYAPKVCPKCQAVQVEGKKSE